MVASLFLCPPLIGLRLSRTLANMPPRSTLFFLTVLCVAAPVLSAQTPEIPVFSGYVTSIGPDGAFDVNGRHIRHDAKTTLTHSQELGGSSHAVHRIDALSPLYLGEEMDVYGDYTPKTKTIHATMIIEKDPPPGSVEGTGVIDQAPSSSINGERTIRADGYLLHITSKTVITWTAPLAGVNDLAANVWVAYHGVQGADGTVVVDKLAAWPNAIKKSEDKLRSKHEYEPSQVDPEDKQSGASKLLLGINPERLPPYQDAAVQARIERIGQSLVPAYQRSLPDSDPTKIHFRFQVVELKTLRDAWSMASGVILVPIQVIDRLKTDAEIAVVLADNIAEILEKQEFLALPGDHAVTTGYWVGTAVGLVIPGVGLATGLTTNAVQQHRITLIHRQSGRVSLWLMHDAGYDIREAPLAWWMLQTKKPKPLEEVKLPDRAANLYIALGTTWHAATTTERVSSH
jgi:hypothetical protein